MWALIIDNVVAEITDIDPAGRFHPSFEWVSAPETAAVGDAYSDGEFVSPASIPPTPEEVRTQKVSLVQSHLDAAAQALGYDTIANAITYAEEPAVAKFQNEGRALRAWRSLVWQRCYEIMAEIDAGDRSVPDDVELIAELPVLDMTTGG